MSKLQAAIQESELNMLRKEKDFKESKLAHDALVKSIVENPAKFKPVEEFNELTLEEQKAFYADGGKVF